MITPNEPYPKLGKAVGAPKLYFKREDLHPLGSHKGRSIPHMIDVHMKSGANHFALSSSGNAALAAGLYVQKLNTDGKHIVLEILVGQNINPKKLARLQTLKSDSIHVSIHDRPKQALLMKTKNSGEGVADTVVSLRQSEDDAALVGYKSLGDELSLILDLQAIFIGTSSGTTAQALAQYFLEHADKKTKKGAGVQIHIIQTPNCHPIADVLRTNADDGSAEIDTQQNQPSLADAIVDRIAFRKDALAPLIEKTGGAAWIADNESILAAQDIVQKHAGLSISPNSALAVAGLMQAIYTGHSWSGSVVCMICGE